MPKSKSYTILIIFLSFFDAISQEQDVLLRDTPVFDCEIVAANSIDIIAEHLMAEKDDSCDIIIKEWENYCGGSEIIYRLRIYLQLKNQKSIKSEVNLFLTNDYSDKYLNRFYASQEDNYGNIYTGNKVYYSYVPLRSKIDSILTISYQKLLDNSNLTIDEELICLLFSGNEDGFKKALKSARKKDSYIKQEYILNLRKSVDYTMSYNLYTGFYKSIGEDNFFNYSPIFGFTFSTPLQYKLQVELGIKFRINQGSKNFDFNAMDMTHNVNSDYSVFFGGLVGYKVLDRKHLKLVPKLGLGLESVSTGISENVEYSDEKEYHDINVPHFSFGITGLTPIFRRNYIGLELSYHYCPYHWNSNLISTFNNNLFSTELIFKF